MTTRDSELAGRAIAPDVLRDPDAVLTLTEVDLRAMAGWAQHEQDPVLYERICAELAWRTGGDGACGHGTVIREYGEVCLRCAAEAGFTEGLEGELTAAARASRQLRVVR